MAVSFLPAPLDLIRFALARLHRMRGLTWGVVLGLIGSACQVSSRPVPPPDALPERQFILHTVRLKVQHKGHVTWTGTAGSADGDLFIQDVTDICLVRKPQAPTEAAFTLQAPQSHLELDAGRASFKDVILHTPQGGILRAPSATYDEHAGFFKGDGPLTFSTPSLQAQAHAASVWFQHATVEIQGPVEGCLGSAVQCR